MYGEGAAVEKLQAYAECTLRQPTARERLLERKKVMEEGLTIINDALKALDENPEFERVHNLISKAL